MLAVSTCHPCPLEALGLSSEEKIPLQRIRLSFMEDHVPATIIYTHLIINSSINNLQTIKFSHFKGIMQWFLLNLQSFATIATTQFYISIIPQRSLVPICRHPPLPMPDPRKLLNYFVFMIYLDVSYKWIHIQCGFLHLASFIWYVFVVHTVACIDILLFLLLLLNSVLFIHLSVYPLH